jgi:glutamyl-tRNA synthetase
MDQLAAHFDLSRTSHSAARFDEAQLRHWQREAVMHATDAEIGQWLGAHLDALPAGIERGAFVAVVRGNVLLPADVDQLVAIVTNDAVPVSGEAALQIKEAGEGFFSSAAGAFVPHAADFKAWTKAIAEATGRKGARLYMPLRSALTGSTHGPELAPLVGLMGAARVQRRLERAQAMAAASA